MSVLSNAVVARPVRHLANVLPFPAKRADSPSSKVNRASKAFTPFQDSIVNELAELRAMRKLNQPQVRRLRAELSALTRKAAKIELLLDLLY